MNARIAAKLSDACYSSPQLDSNRNQKTIDIEGDSFRTVKHVDMPSGYQGSIYQNIKTGEYVVAHRGTEFDRQPLTDGAIDLGMVTTRFNGQLKDALELTREAKEIADREGKEVSVTGHSWAVRWRRSPRITTTCPAKPSILTAPTAWVTAFQQASPATLRLSPIM
ncbi:hypothetical protein [Stenotrophomonas cyclobalanopsidis]|uniref:hypothetical protein n=1 Tax=Stenotrophomonas cyclobalanopsidis TaxID=2771362 RepID=UPI002FD9B7D5